MPFIVIEGLDGSGGQTQTHFLKEYFEREGSPYTLVTSPDYDHDIGKLFDKYLHGKVELNTEQVFLLCCMDVLNSVKKIKGLEEDKMVIADRYITSTLAYRDAAGFSIEKGMKIVEILDFPKPDAIIFLNISPETSMKRKLKEKESLDIHEKNKKYLSKVKESYQKQISNNILGKWFVIDGEKSKKEVHEEILRIINSLK
jgi:dTMP kinase